ncbi:epoxide hydrolase 1-like [Cicer arietinum]|uniref:soluble epoxide hydrolase n=1 Tax=Cicer arietinum TaxID=3827 RepID=A0A1S3E262_CICAR|nr:uncharacterized protein LOC105851828 [Cicer arietinum]
MGLGWNRVIYICIFIYLYIDISLGSSKELEGIEHRTIEANGIKIHIAEKGKEGPVVLFLHGFPESWYSWRHQIAALGSLGYRAVAPDLRGYGDTEVPSSISNYTIFDLVGDIVGVIDALGVDKVFLVGHDWGAVIGWQVCLFHPERVKAYVALSVPYAPRNPILKPVTAMRLLYGNDFYICRFQEPGKAEAEFAKVGAELVIRGMLTTRTPGPPILPKDGFGSDLDPANPPPLPSWLSQEDLSYYVSKFDKSGFTGALNYYRNINLNWKLTASWTGARVKVPVKFITGDLDLVYHLLGTKLYIKSGAFKLFVPNLEEVVIQKGVAHFINQEVADNVTNHIYEFIKKF